VVNDLNKSLLPLINADEDFTEATPLLFSKEFVKRSKDRCGLPLLRRNRDPLDLNSFFEGPPPTRRGGGGGGGHQQPHTYTPGPYRRDRGQSNKPPSGRGRT
jgi:hypothetical protein